MMNRIPGGKGSSFQGFAEAAVSVRTIMEYRGHVVALNQEKGFGWIDRNSVVGRDGNPIDLHTEQDIYFHFKEIPPRTRETVKVGSIVKFRTQPDERRKNAWSAYGLETLGMFIPGGVDLHIDASEIDNPGVPMRWCFTPEALRRITDGLTQGYGYAVLLVGKKRGDIFATREIREVHTWNQPFTIFTFGSPGEWDVVVLLYESKEICTKGFRTTSEQLELDLRRKFLHKHRQNHRLVYELEFEDLHGLSYSEYWPRYWVGYKDQSAGAPAVMSLITVAVPKAIFAPEPSPAMKAYANYFFSHQPGDQCDYRRRLLIMIPGFVPWVLIEGAKRFICLLVGLAALSVWLESTPVFFKNALKPAVKLGGPGYAYESTPNGRMWPFNRKPLQWFVPGMLGVYGSVAYLILKVFVPFLGKQLTQYHDAVVKGSSWTSTIVVIAALVWFIAYSVKKRFDSTLDIRVEKEVEYQKKRRQERQEAAIRRGRQQAARAIEYAPALVCGDAPAQVSLKAIPPKLRSTHMLFAAVKQQVCRPFAR